jgi:hypothetical protein
VAEKGNKTSDFKTREGFLFHSRIVHLDIIKVFYLPTDA